MPDAIFCRNGASVLAGAKYCTALLSCLMQQVGDNEIDFRLQVVRTLLEPALTIARVTALPLSDLVELVELGYLREHQARGLSLTQIAERVGRSRRTVATLSRRAKEQASGARKRSGYVYLRTQLMRALGHEQQRTGEAVPFARLARLLGKRRSSDLHKELRVLVEQGVVGEITAKTPHYQVKPNYIEELGAGRELRIAGLRHFLSAVTALVHQRFLVRGPEEAFARSLGFSATREQLERIRETVWKNISEQSVAADESVTLEKVDAQIVFGLTQLPSDPFLTSQT